jgi:hypothetical protein
MLRRIATCAVFVFALPVIAVAQSAPAPPTDAARTAFAERGATMALRGAYHWIADAEARGASTYLDAAKVHYRNALARLQRHDAGAASEAMAASALARASEAEHPVAVPHDIPAPPELVAGPGGPMQHAGPPMPQRGLGMRGHGMSGRFDATRLAADAKLANTPEASDLAQKALDADIARTHAAFSGNAQEAMRQGRLASDLALAVRSLALADHPRTFERRRPMTPGTTGGGS